MEVEGGSREERRSLSGQWLFVEKYFNILMTSRILLEHDKAESTPHSVRLFPLGRMKWEIARSYKCLGILRHDRDHNEFSLPLPTAALVTGIRASCFASPASHVC